MSAMRTAARRVTTALTAIGLGVGLLTACSSGGNSFDPQPTPVAAPPPSGKLTIGISFDQPGLGLKDGDTYSVEVNAKTIINAIFTAVKPLTGALGSLGDGGVATADSDIAKIPDGVVTGPASGVADDVCIALAESGVFRGIETGVHAGENGEMTRGRERELTLRSE